MPRASFFLQITPKQGKVDGEAEEHDFEGAIEVTSWDWGVSDKDSKKSASEDGGAKKGTTGGHGETGGQTYEPKPLRFTKATDRSTTRLLSALISDEVFPSAIFTLRQQWKSGQEGGKEANEEFLLHMILLDVRVTNYNFNARSQNASVDLDEDWVFDYRTLQFDYKSAPGLYMHGPGLGEQFFLPPGSKATALKKPGLDVKRSIDELKAINDQNKAEIERLRRSKS